jgi:hypothetical protein
MIDRTQSLYLLLVQRYISKDTTTVETLQLNSFNTLPFLLIYSIINQDMFKALQYERLGNPVFIFVFFATYHFLQTFFTSMFSLPFCKFCIDVKQATTEIHADANISGHILADSTEHQLETGR